MSETPTVGADSDPDMNSQLLKTMQEMTASNRAMILKFDELDAKMSKNATTMDTHITKVETHMTEVLEEIESLKERCDSAEKRLSDGETTCKQLRIENLRLLRSSYKDRERIRHTEEAAKRENIIIEGVPEVAGETPRKVIHNLLVDIGAIGAGVKVSLESAFRIGRVRAAASSPRNILIRFKDIDNKIALFQNVNKMRHLNKWKKVYISDDLTVEQQGERKDLRCLSALGAFHNLSLKLKGNKLENEAGRTYYYKDIKDLPVGINLKAAKVIEFTHGTAFQSHHAYLSNMFPCSITYNEVTWSSSEQLFWYLMAEYHEDHDTAMEIASVSDGYEAKKVSHKIKRTKDDSKKKYEVMEQVIEMKFMQDNELGDQLIASKGRLWECTTEKGWGCGHTISNIDDIDPNAPTESNKMGDLLVKLREKMKKL